MSKQRKRIPPILGIDAALDHASALVQEYTKKLRAISRRIRDVHEKYLAEMDGRLKQLTLNSTTPAKLSPDERQIWIAVVDGFQSLHNEYIGYLSALIPQAVKLAQHVSQLITHGTSETIVRIELSLRVAELESAIRTAQTLAATHLVFITP
jgi:hypothetical protein